MSTKAKISRFMLRVYTVNVWLHVHIGVGGVRGGAWEGEKVGTTPCSSRLHSASLGHA